MNWVVLSCLFLAGVWLFFSFKTQGRLYAYSFEAPATHSLAYCRDKIGWGPLGLNGMRSLGPVPGLARDLVLLGRSTRPDICSDTPLLIGFKTTGQQKQIKSGDVLFLKKEGENFSFSLEKTDLAIQPLALEGEGVLIEVFSGLEKGDFLVKNVSPRPLEEQEYVKSFKGAAGWGPDIFLQNFGGPDYQDLLRKYKVEIGGKVFFVSEGDFFSYRDEGWSPAVLSKEDLKAPLARIERVSPRSIEVQIWDETGFEDQRISLNLQQGQKAPYKAEELLGAVRPRSSAECSCLLGKRRVVLKEGDWWLKTALGWKSLKRIADIEDFIEHRLQGELFIFEKIENDKGKTLVRGHYFDPMRTQMQTLAVTLNTEKKAGSKGVRESRGSPMIAKGDEKVRIQVPQFQNKEADAR